MMQAISAIYDGENYIKELLKDRNVWGIGI